MDLFSGRKHLKDIQEFFFCHTRTHYTPAYHLPTPACPHHTAPTYLPAPTHLHHHTCPTTPAHTTLPATPHCHTAYTHLYAHLHCRTLHHCRTPRAHCTAHARTHHTHTTLHTRTHTRARHLRLTHHATHATPYHRTCGNGTVQSRDGAFWLTVLLFYVVL